MERRRSLRILLLCSIVSLVPLGDVSYAQVSPAIQRGAYVFHAAGGCSCHTDVPNKGPLMAGWRALTTPFGVIYSTNITPDLKTGIGQWSDADFVRAMTQGIGPHGKRYFPVFPYTSFTRMSAGDLLDLKAYLFSLPPIERPNRAPELRFPFGWRFGIRFWKWRYFQPGTFQPDASQSPEWNRGAYLATALGHCAECHTPRTWLGGLQTSMAYAGAVDGPEGEAAPNITPDETTGIGRWSTPDIVWFLETGFKPDGDDTQGLMSEQIEHGYRHLKEEDLQAIAAYLQTLKPIQHRIVKPEKAP